MPTYATVLNDTENAELGGENGQGETNGIGLVGQ